MADSWEDTLRKWKNPPSENEKSKRNRTEAQIREALESHDFLDSPKFSVYAKGSYANNTNVRLDYDVDIAVECKEFFYSDLIGNPGGISDKYDLDIVPYSGGYTKDQFKSDVELAFGRKAVERGTIALRVRENKTTLPADVVPCFEYRRIHSVKYPFDGSYDHAEGHCVFPKGGSKIKNYPKSQKVNGTAKNNRTGHRYKSLVRILKRLENQLSNENLIADLPSYLVECLVYNVPDEYFGHDSYLEDLRAVLATIYNETMNQEKCKYWMEVNGIKYLFRSSQNWSYSNAHDFADKAWDYVGFS